ncbi:MAG TPA: hypothetical protein VKI65_02840, partial [Gemmataceae bacterium]|nr:hypothetical protein [Gemmataceae bacterium]
MRTILISRLLAVLAAAMLLASVVISQPIPPQPTLTAPSPYKSPLGLAVDQSGQRAYVAIHSAGTVAVVDLQAGKVLSEISVGQGPYDLAVAADRLLVTCERDDTLA